MDLSVDSPAPGVGGEQPRDKDKPKSKEPRVGRACDPCRRAKVRCLAQPDQPCARCKNAKLDCTFEQKATKRGPPKGYVESLERRLEAMEALLRALSATSSADMEQLPSADFGYEERAEDPGSSRDQSTPGSTAALSPEAARNGVAGDSVDRLAADLEELSVDKDRYVGRGSGLHLARSIREFSKTDIPSTNVADEADQTPSIVELLLQEDHHRTSFHFELPVPDLREKLLDAYWAHVNRDSALLHRPSFERSIANGSLERDTAFRSLFFMVCAVAARFVDDERLDIQYSATDATASKQSKGFEYFRASSGSASPALMSATLYDIQSSVLAIYWLLGAATPISAWACVGFAIRRVVDVGAHRENRIRWNASPLEDQLRRRAFHALFGFDRNISASLGRPLAIHDEDCDLGPPLDISDEALDEWNLLGPSSPPPPTETPGPLAGVNCLARLQRIMGRALRLLYGMNRQSNTPQKATAAVTELDSLLNEWLNDVPEHLKWNPATQDPRWLSQSVLLYASYYSTQILCHRDFISPSRQKLHAFPSLAICSNAARSCSHVLDALRQRGLAGDSFWFIPLAAVTSGLVLLINVFANGPSGASLTSSAMSDVKKCVAILEDLSPTTFLASKCSSGLERLCSMAGHQPHQRDPSAPSLKRVNEWEDSESPQSSGSLSNQPSPSAGADGAADEHGSKRKRESLHHHHHHHRPKGSLPLTTDDLSLLTFNGRPTFAPQPADGAPWTAGLPSAHMPFAPQLPDNTPAFPQQQMTFDTLAWNHPTGSLPPATAVDWQLDAFGASIPPPPESQAFENGGLFIDPNNPFGAAYGTGGFDSQPGSFDWPNQWNQFDFDSILPLMTGQPTDR